MTSSEDGRAVPGAGAAEEERVPRSRMRQRVFKGASAAFNQEFSAIPCTVRDLSETGARLQFEEGWFVPDRFTLFVDVDGFKVECERVWQKGRLCGVRFTGPRSETSTYRPQVLRAYRPDETGPSEQPVEPLRPPAPDEPRAAPGIRRPFGRR